jgi:hypothetical protein
MTKGYDRVVRPASVTITDPVRRSAVRAYDRQMTPSRTIVAVAACTLTIAACDGDDDSEAAATSVPVAVDAPTTEAPATTEGAGTTTPATTVAAPVENLAVVWASSVDSNRVNTELPQPRWVVNETTVALDIVGMVDNDPTAGQRGEICRDAVELLDTDDQQCMLVQFRFDVGSQAVERGGIFVPHVITAEGRQIDLFVSETAWPGTVDNALVFVVPGAGPGSTIVFTVNDGLGLGIDSLEQNIEFVTPDAAEWMPVDFLDD